MADFNPELGRATAAPWSSSRLTGEKPKTHDLATGGGSRRGRPVRTRVSLARIQSHAIVTNTHNLYVSSPLHVTSVTSPLPRPRKHPLPKVSVAARIERGYYDELVGIIDADDHFNRLGDFVREAVVEKIQRWKKDHPLSSPGPRQRSRES